MNKHKLLKDNIIAFVVYLLGALLSFVVSIPGTYFFPIWLPVALSAGQIFFKGRSVFYGVTIAGLVSHVFLGSIIINKAYFSPAQPFLMVLTEYLVSLSFVWFRDKYNWLNIGVRKGNEIKQFFVFAILSAIPIAIAHTWFNVFEREVSFFHYFSSNYFILLTNFLVIIPLYISFYRKGFKQIFESNQLMFVLLVLVVLVMFIWYDAYFLHFIQKKSLLPLFLIGFLSFSYISIRYNSRVYSTTLGLYSLLLLFSVWYFGAYESLDNLLTSFSHTSGFLLVLSITTLYLKENYEARVQAVNALKTEYGFIDEEISRQVKEYRLLNDQLFEEIEKRGLAERELEHSRNLLSEAQQVGKISTWEFSVSNNLFSWISQVDSTLLSGLDEKTYTLKQISKIVHSDDIKLVKNSASELLKGSKKDIELEIRLQKSQDNYGFYLIRGRGFFENGKLSRVLGLVMDITERKISEEILREKELKYQALFESNIDPICVIDAETLVISDVNSAFERIYGYSKHEIKGKQYTIVSAQPSETKSSVEYAKQKGFYRVNQRIHRRKNGEEFFVEGSLMIHLLEGRSVIFIVTHDITRRKESENSLAEREQKFRTFFESDLIGMAEVSLTRDWISFNDKLCQILGYNRKELKEISWDQITHSDDLQYEEKFYNQLITHKIDSYSVEKRFTVKNSRVVFCRVTTRSVKTALGTIAYFILLIDDITDRKRAEQELIESRAKLSHAQSVAKLGIIRFVSDSNIIILSDEAYEILGFGKKRPQLTRRDFFKSILPDSKTRFEEHICNIEKGEANPGSHEQAILTPKGEVRYILTNFGYTPNSDNQVSEVLVTLADITRIKQAEMALQEANALKDQIFSIIGHDLRSPIGALKQLIDVYIANRKDYDEESANSILETLSQTSEETFKLLENLLEWAKSQRTVSFKPEKIDLIHIANEVLTLKKGVADGKGIVLQTEFPNKAIAMIDAEMMKTVIRNLISNSIKFTPNSGFILLKIESIGENFVVSVSDTGKGIPKDVIPKLFDNSQSFTTPGTNDEKGTGLGLKLVKKFVERNGGSISVESSPGQGSVFSFTIPKYIDKD